MTCRYCRKRLTPDADKCPHCGKDSAGESSGVFQSSTVLISAKGTEMMYRSVEEIPDPLRHKLLKSTNSSNSATILIADRRGRKEIAKALRNLPGSAQRRMVRSLLSGNSAPESVRWLTPRRKKLILAAVLTMALALIAFVFTHRW
jgi:hypothetical protein